MGIEISQKHGLNPSITVCPVCGKHTGLVLHGRLKGDIEAPKYIIDNNLCDDCKEKAKAGYIAIIEVESKNNPIQTGRAVWVKKEAINVDCPKFIALMVSSEFNNIIKE